MRIVKKFISYVSIVVTLALLAASVDGIISATTDTAGICGTILAACITAIPAVILYAMGDNHD